MRRRFMNKKDNKKHLSFIALEDGMSITFTFNGTAYYSVNNEEWKRMESGVGTEEVKAGSIIYVKGNTSNPSFEISKKCKLSGFCASILYGDKVSKYSVVYESCFSGLFYNCTTIVEVDNILPATTLASECYSHMFFGCTSLVKAPELPATTLASYCYSYMFHGCTSLVKAPELPATTLASYCYNGMFYGDAGLVKAPELPATTLASYCYGRMFHYCNKLNYIKMLASDISAEGCLDGWVSVVSSTGTFVKSKDATWDTTPGALGTSGVPAGWTVVNDGEESGGGETQPFFRVQNFNGTRALTYNFEIGMTFGDFVESKYNVDNWSSGVFLEPGVYNIYHQYDDFISDGDGYVTDLDYIVQGGTYYWD